MLKNQQKHVSSWKAEAGETAAFGQIYVKFATSLLWSFKWRPCVVVVVSQW